MDSSSHERWPVWLVKDEWKDLHAQRRAVNPDNLTCCERLSLALQGVDYTMKLQQVSKLLLTEALDSLFSSLFTKHSKKHKK